MSTFENLKSFVFNAMLIEDSLFSLQKQGVPIKEGIEQQPVSRIVSNEYNPLLIQQALDMSSVYTILFCIENTLRDFIVQRLSERKGLDWWNTCVPKKVQEDANKLKAREEQNKYLSTRGDSPINYTMLDNLAQIVINNWDDFSDIIPNQSWIQSRMHDLTMCRNVIMHTGVLSRYDIERIESISRDFMSQLG